MLDCSCPSSFGGQCGLCSPPFPTCVPQLSDVVLSALLPNSTLLLSSVQLLRNTGWLVDACDVVM